MPHRLQRLREVLELAPLLCINARCIFWTRCNRIDCEYDDVQKVTYMDVVKIQDQIEDLQTKTEDAIDRIDAALERKTLFETELEAAREFRAELASYLSAGNEDEQYVCVSCGNTDCSCA